MKILLIFLMITRVTLSQCSNLCEPIPNNGKLCLRGDYETFVICTPRYTGEKEKCLQTGFTAQLVYSYAQATKKMNKADHIYSHLISFLVNHEDFVPLTSDVEYITIQRHKSGLHHPKFEIRGRLYDMIIERIENKNTLSSVANHMRSKNAQT